MILSISLAVLAATASPQRESARRDTPARIPAAFVGRWETTRAACDAEPSEDTLIIEPDALQYYEQREVVTRLVVHAPRDITIRVAGAYGDDEWSETHRIRVSEDGREIRFEAAEAPSYRCAG